jgi:peptide/nickel transport system ATP-binding protein
VMVVDRETLLRFTDVARYFDVSPPWLERVIERQPRRIVKAVDGVSFEIARGSAFALVGESGCGKSTVARLAVGLLTPTRGRIEFEGRDMTARGTHADARGARRRLQMIFQDPYASLNPRWRVADIIAEPIRAHAQAHGMREVRARVDALLAQVGLAPADGEKYPHEFSGGQRQRISIARALASRPDFLVCDEPTSALDVSVQAQILNLMRELQSVERLTYLFISHNLAVVRQISDRLGVMYLGRIVESGDTRTIFGAPLHPYTRMLLDAIPDIAMRGGARAQVAGEVPSPIEPPSGCVFHPRCPFAQPRCAREKPLARPTAGGSLVACHGVEERRLAYL